MSRNGLYTLMLGACASGGGWLVYLCTNPQLIHNASTTPCLIRHTTGLPCPSCGSSRAVLSLLQGDFLQSIYWNPLGLIILAIMVIGPLWIIRDLVTGSHSFFHFYRRVESWLRIKWVAIAAVLLVMSNWIWTISKGI
jgi:hypothetical protein